MLFLLVCSKTQCFLSWIIFYLPFGLYKKEMEVKFLMLDSLILTGFSSEGVNLSLHYKKIAVYC